MRIRKKPWAEEELAQNDHVMKNAEALKGKWREYFGNDNPIYVEIGCGKGQFILETARRNPDINFVAIEKEEGALIMATEKAVAQALPNLRFLSFDAAALGEIFAPGEVSLIYLNFSDPWPPNRQRKRRLTWRAFLAVYDIMERDHADVARDADVVRNVCRRIDENGELFHGNLLGGNLRLAISIS